MAANIAVLILRTVSKHCPELYKDHAGELVRGAGASGLGEDDDDLDGSGGLDPDADEEMVDVAKEVYLGALSSLLRYDPSLTVGVTERFVLHQLSSVFPTG